MPRKMTPPKDPDAFILGTFRIKASDWYEFGRLMAERYGMSASEALVIYIKKCLGSGDPAMPDSPANLEISHQLKAIEKRLSNLETAKAKKRDRPVELEKAG